MNSGVHHWRLPVPTGPEQQALYPVEDSMNCGGGNDPPADKPKPARKSLVSSILRGSGHDSDEHEELHVTYSKLMARGKYVHELQVHNVKPEAMDDYIALTKENYPRVANDSEFHVKLFGSWVTEIGDLDQAIHIWEYNHYPGYIQTQDLLKRDPQYQQFQKKLAPMLRSRENQMMLEFAFWTSSAPITTNGIYELRTYLLKPGKMLEWEHQWRAGLEARRKFVQPVGAWFSQLGHLNYVHHMWAYPDLQVRKEMREKAWEVEGWSQTVHKTVTLIDHMQSRIVTPLDFSPMK
ncbi:hypothetical protein HK105_201615 [Polyrhizophydium stewartii]|uniref:NIPSNAP domain-containing protein n=1 Tax=Polyrhizophydium stewartii TaxID=2732419 RepID=A0ABR4NH33_9FUNG